MQAKSIQAKARLFGDELNEDFINMMLDTTCKEASLKQRKALVSFFNTLLESKEEAKLSNEEN